jgi:5-methyltetrahydropteroyltriglutamate--homocysteine methyltransferase
VIVGVLDLADDTAETPELVVERIEAALQVVPAERLQVGPDCGMKYLPRDSAFGKLAAMTAAAALLRGEAEA